MKKYLIILVIVVLLLLVAGIAGFFYLKSRTGNQLQNLQNRARHDRLHCFRNRQSFAVTTVQVGTQVSGTIQKLYVDYNSRVKKGQAIAEIDPSLFNASVEQSQGNFLMPRPTC